MNFILVCLMFYNDLTIDRMRSIAMGFSFMVKGKNFGPKIGKELR